MAEPTGAEGLAAAVEALVRRGDLDRGSPAYATALSAIDRGYDGLRRAEKRLFDRAVAPVLATLRAPQDAQPRPRSVDPEPDNPWRPLRGAPRDRAVQLGLMDRGGISPLAFGCRKVGRSWVRADTGERLPLRPSHWREWLPG